MSKQQTSVPVEAPKVTKPESIKNDPWTDFPKQPYSIFNDDFVHEKLFVWKVNTKGNKSNINFKATLSEAKGLYSVGDEVKLWVNLPEGRSIYSKIKSSNYLKLHYDHGFTNCCSRNWNLYATVNASKAIQQLSLKLGVAHISPKCTSDNRLKVEFLPEGKKDLTLYHRTTNTIDKYTLSFVGVYNITSNLIKKNNLLLGYQHDDRTYASVRLENQEFRSTPTAWTDWKKYFSTVTLDFVQKYNEQFKYGLQAVVKTEGKFDSAQLVLQHYESKNKLTTKLLVSSKLDAALLLKLPTQKIFDDIATASVGVAGYNLKSQKRTWGYGAQLEFNV